MNLIDIKLGTIIWTLVNFTTLLLLLRFFAWKPIVATLRAREQAIKDALDRAETAKTDAERIMAENQSALKKAEEESQRVLRDSREFAERIQQEASQKAQEESKNMILQARLEIERNKEQALIELRGEVANLAVGGAEKILKESLASNAERNRKIVDDYLQQTAQN